MNKPARAVLYMHLVAALAASLLGGATSVTPALAYDATLSVTTATDELDSTGSSTGCSLREAIHNANNNSSTYPECGTGVGIDAIAFSIGSGTQTITLGSTLAVTSPVAIDGTTQPGFVAGGPGVPLIVITGTPGVLIDFQTGSAGSTIKSVRLVNTLNGSLGMAIRLQADSITVTGNYFHTDGTASLGGDDTVGVLFADSDLSTVGGPTTLYRNIFGGHTGIRLDNGSSNILRNNYFGVQPAGVTALTSLPGDNDAINICYYDGLADCTSNTVDLNVITGFYDGVYLGQYGHNTALTGNKIGIGAGSQQLPNHVGVYVRGSDNNVIGGTTAAARNVISANYINILLAEFSGNTPANNTIQGNYIGLKADGVTRTTAWGDVTHDVAGIEVREADNTTIGGTAAGSGNVIAGNYYGINLPYVTPTNTIIRGNRIGTDYTGTSAVIQAFGIYNVGADLEIGSASTPGNNLISGNDAGVFILSSTGTTVYGNRIGVSAVGNLPLPNSVGISLGGAAPTISGNWIGYQTSYGLFIDATSSVGAGSVNNCFTSNGVHAVNSGNSGGTAVLTGNWWNSSTGPTHSGNPGGTGDAVTDYISYSPFRTSMPAACRPAPTDFDGDKRTDPAKFIPGTGFVWWFKSSTNLWDGRNVGMDTTTYVRRSDFDGDGRTDSAKYVSGGEATWYFGSADSTLHGEYIGSNVYLLPGSDFDGDNKTDHAKYTADGSIWRKPSGGGGWVGTFIGTDAAPALPGCDFDGDNKDDLAKYVPAAGAIWYLGSADSTWHGMYIGSDGTPVPGSDFDGDGITDFAKVLPSNNLWYRRSSDSVWVGVYLGPGSFTYVPAADFDGDGMTDPAKFDTVGKGLWWLKSSTNLWASQYMGGEVYDIVN